MVGKVVLLNPLATFKDGLDNILNNPSGNIIGRNLDTARKAGSNSYVSAAYYAFRYVFFCGWLTKPLWSWNSFVHLHNPWDTRSIIREALTGIDLLILSNIGDRQAPPTGHRELYHLAGGQKLPDLDYGALYESDKLSTHYGRIHETAVNGAKRAIIQVPGGHEMGILNFFRTGNFNPEMPGMTVLLQNRPEFVWEDETGPDFIAKFLDPSWTEAELSNPSPSDSPAPPVTPAPLLKSGEKSNTVTIVIMIVLVAVCLVAVGIAIWCCLRRKAPQAAGHADEQAYQ